MISAFGIEHNEISKADVSLAERNRRRNRSGSAMAGAGAATVGLGVTGEAILSGRLEAHHKETKNFTAKARTAPRATNNAEAFYRGHVAGKVEPELKVIRGMTKGRSGVRALGAGGALLGAAGLAHRRKIAKADRKKDARNAALLGGGLTGAGLTTAVPLYLDRHKKAYEASATRKVDAAGKLAPGLAGRQERRKEFSPSKAKHPTMYPKVSDGEVKRNPKLVQGLRHEAVTGAGRLRGAAAQERHFAEVFRDTSRGLRAARLPAVAAAGVGGVGLARSRHNVHKKATPAALGRSTATTTHRVGNFHARPTGRVRMAHAAAQRAAVNVSARMDASMPFRAATSAARLFS